MSALFKRPFLSYLFVFLLLLITGAVVFRDYFSLDEADILWEVRTGSQWKIGFRSMLSDGRPVYSFLVTGSLTLLKTFTSLKFLRLVSILDLFLVCLLLFRFMKRQGMSVNHAFIASVMIFTLPGICVYIPWAECWDQHLATVFALLGGTLLVRVLTKHLGALPEGQQSLTRWNEYVYFGAAIVLEQAALMTYQNLALAFVIPAFMMLLIKKDVSSRNRSIFFFYVGLSFVLALGLYYQLIGSILNSVNVPLSSRAGFTTHYLEKAKWIVSMFFEATKLNLVLFKGPVQYVFPWLLGAAVARDIFKKRFQDLFFLLAFCVMVFLPHLVLVENWGATRNFGLMSLLLSFYLVLRTGELVKAFTTPVAAGTALVFTGIMCFFFWESWVKPEQMDYEYMKTFVQKIPSLKEKDIRLEVKPPEWNLYEKDSRIKAYADEYNDPLFGRLWPILPSIKLMYADQHPDITPEQIDNFLHVKVLKKEEPFTADSVAVLNVDLNRP
jgi:hypothetical protein